MIANLGLILLCQLMGEIAVREIGLPIPGPVIGLMLLFLLLLGRDRIALLQRGPLQGAASRKRPMACWPICRCCSFRPVSASFSNSISSPNTALRSS